MSLQDPVADFLTRLRNASIAQLPYADFFPSNFTISIANLLLEHGFIRKVLIDREKNRARIVLKYAPGYGCILKGLKRVSRPSLRRYVACADIPSVRGGMGLTVLSTSKGVVSGEVAKKLHVGGEVVCMIW